jgi:hypothetical protein
MKKVNYLSLIPVFLFIIILLTLHLCGRNNINKFIQQSINCKIVKRNNWQLRATEFYLQNGLRIDSSYIQPFDVKVGDSIAKKANSKKFNVYRKVIHEYEYLQTYDIEKTIED